MPTPLQRANLPCGVSGKDQAACNAGSGMARRPQAVLKFLLVLSPLGYLWFRLIDNLRLEWSTNPQYGYGWVVPLLCLGLLVRRWHALAAERTQNSELSGQPSALDSGLWSHNRLFILLCVAFALLYLPTRLIEEATPEWRPIQWSLALVVIGLTLCAVYFRRGGAMLREAAFPVCFLLVAVPWPTLVETPIIQGLARINATLVVEVVGWFGVPAMQLGNVIEVSTGVVGIDDACSGIRSFQSSLMISLFLGEFYRLGFSKRALLVPAGFMLAMAFNVVRTSFLTLVAARKGMAAISEYHDNAGLTILLACTAVMWGLAILLSSRQSEVRARKSELGSQKSQVRGQASALNLQPSTLNRLSLALVVWLGLVESGVQWWYRSRESHVATAVNWSIAFPLENPTFKIPPMSVKTENLLRFDEGKQGEWREPDGTEWQAFYFSWRPGRVAGYLAKRHTPDICLPALGQKMVSGAELTVISVHGVELPMRSYVFKTGTGPLQVFQCRWEAGASREDYVQEESARFNLVRGVWAGRGKNGQKVLEIVIKGLPDAQQAKTAVVRQLNKLIKVESSGTDPGPVRSGVAGNALKES